MPSPVRVIGGGPAGSAAAIGALRAGRGAMVYEQSRAVRHRVCGEFISPEILKVLESIGLARAFRELSPQPYRRLALHFQGVSKHAILREPAWGMSRVCFDGLLRGHAERLGAEFISRREPTGAPPLVLAAGRRPGRVRGTRWFGFKAHFDAPATDSIELFFFRGAYVGVNSVEAGVTNVCGVAPEPLLREYGFAPDGLLEEFAPLRARLAGGVKRFEWLRTGPLEFGITAAQPSEPGVYRAGDALAFADPFTGSGLVSAVYSGLSAGRAAAGDRPVEEHTARCRHALRQPFLVSSFFRWAWQSGNANWLVRWVPHRTEWLMALTRPRFN